MKRTLSATLVALAAAVTFSACTPPPSEFIPDPDRFWKMIQQTIQTAINVVIGHPKENLNIDCAVVLFDQSVRAVDRMAVWTPVHPPAPELFPVWFTACFGIGKGPHIAPTFRASGYPNTPGQAQQAVCWVSNPVPEFTLGDMKFRCYFDMDPHLAWVVPLQENRWGYLAVGALS